MINFMISDCVVSRPEIVVSHDYVKGKGNCLTDFSTTVSLFNEVYKISRFEGSRVADIIDFYFSRLESVGIELTNYSITCLPLCYEEDECGYCLLDAFMDGVVELSYFGARKEYYWRVTNTDTFCIFDSPEFWEDPESKFYDVVFNQLLKEYIS